ATQAGYLAERLAEYRLTLECPDFNKPDCTSLTVTRMLDQLGDALARVAPDRVALVGSSLGGALAILAAARLPDLIDRLVLLAPAVMFAKPGHHLLPPERVEEWQRRGALPFFHFGYGDERLL